MLASTALRQSSSEKSLKSPGGGPPALLIRMSGFGHASSRARRPSSVVTSQAMAVTLGAPSWRRCSAVASSASLPRAQIVSSTPSRASASAHPLPKPLDAAQTIADLPLMPRSMASFPPMIMDAGEYARDRSMSTGGRPLQPAFAAEIQERQHCREHHHQERQRIAESPVELRHETEVHPVNGCDERRRQQHDRNHREQLDDLVLLDGDEPQRRIEQK